MTIKEQIEDLTNFNIVNKVKDLLNKFDKEKATITKVGNITELEGSVVVADISAKVDELIAALKAAGVIDNA